MVEKALVCLLMLITPALNIIAQQRPGGENDESAIREIEQKWDAANLRGDAAALDAIFADTFIMTGEDGKVRTKVEVIRELKAGNINYQAAKTEELKVLLHGGAAVVSGRWRGQYVYQGKTVKLLERFTNFYVRRAGRWQCVASHGSAIK
jgi:ketosteroid isomerase-like protein